MAGLDDQKKLIESVRNRVKVESASRSNSENVEELVQEKRKEYIDLVRADPTSHNSMILLLGTPGTGKSSFINTCAAATYDKYFQVADIGEFDQGFRVHVDQRKLEYYHLYEQVQRIDGSKKLCHRHHEAEGQQNEPLPSFRDFAGLPDENDAEARLVLKALLYNLLPNGFSKKQLNEFIRQRGLNASTELLPERLEDLPTQRVLVFWAADQAVPVNFLKSVIEVVNPMEVESTKSTCGITFPIFGIVTNFDKVGREELDEETYQAKKTLFKKTLGIPWDRVLEIQNYNDELTPARSSHNYPKIDLEVLTILCTVMKSDGAPSRVSEAAMDGQLGVQVTRARKAPPTDGTRSGNVLSVGLAAGLTALLIGSEYSAHPSLLSPPAWFISALIIFLVVLLVVTALKHFFR